MLARIGVWTTVLLLLGGSAFAQQEPWRGAAGPPQPAGPSAAVQPPARQQPMVQQPVLQPPQFVLTPQQQAYVDQVLAAWEARSEGIKRFETKFTKYEHNAGLARPGDPPLVDEGVLKYEKPDKGYFQVKGDNGRPELWICDGRSIFEYKYEQNTRVEYPLPPNMQGQAIKNGPLPFLFGAKAQELKDRYWIRAVAPPEGADEVWLEACPKLQQQAADFKQADLILDRKTVLPKAIQLHLSNGNSRTVYAFHGIVVNDPDLLRFLKGDPFNANTQTPLGWKKVVDTPKQARAGAQPTPEPRR